MEHPVICKNRVKVCFFRKNKHRDLPGGKASSRFHGTFFAVSRFTVFAISRFTVFAISRFTDFAISRFTVFAISLFYGSFVELSRFTTN